MGEEKWGLSTDELLTLVSSLPKSSQERIINYVGELQQRLEI